ncbi:MAG: ABC transporter [Campylobacteraceae bacterium 4484_4]|nr:MAG: ABC transporter [Campylobacteraceae bacterium 4484_4]
MKRLLHLYSPVRIWLVFRFLLTLFLVIKRRERFLLIPPLSPVALREAIVRLGASFIKLAQVLATRADFFTPAYLAELKSLHDELPPMRAHEFDRIYRKAFGNKEIFRRFESDPIAAASIGQVHIAWLQDGTKVAVKLRRFEILERVRADITILNFFNSLFKPLFSYYTKNSIEAVIAEFSSMIMQEVSMRQELENLKKFSEVYHESGIRFPVPFENYCTDDALVMSFEEGYRFDDKEALKREEIDFRPLIERLVHFYTEQMLIRGFFHADPHPGNLLVSPEGELILLDFGMVKRIPNETRIAIIELIKAAHERDYELYVSANKKLGTIAYEAPKAELAEFTERMFDIFSNESLDAMSMQNLAFEVLATTRNFPFKLPQEAIYVLRVSAIIEGLGTTYIENFNGIKDILPILQQNIPRALGAQESIIETLIDEFKSVPFTIREIKNTFKLASEGELSVQLSTPQLEWLFKELHSYLRPVILGLTLMLAAIFTLLIDHDLQLFASILFGLGILRIIYH